MRCCFFGRRPLHDQRNKQTSIEKSATHSFDNAAAAVSSSHVKHYSLKTLHAATQGFHPSCKIGQGGFGSVYKGLLEDRTIVAVKVLSAKSTQGDREFLAEIESMRAVEHKNLLRLRGFCTEGSNRILVYDYMENSSLAQNLLSGKLCAIDFTWEVRKKICLGIASGLAYLHEEVKPHIIHRDIKPSNILLDSDLNPKISDFGLAKLFPDNVTHISTRVAGTIGYLAPEYARCGKLTRKSDVYSFGMLLLEIVNGRCSTNFLLEIDDNLINEAWELYKDGKLLQLVDPFLKGEFPDQEAVQFLRVALLCVQGVPALRPSMSRVVKMLSNEINIRNIQISQPGVLTDFRKMKISVAPEMQCVLSRGSSSTSHQFSNSTSPKDWSESSSQLTSS